jgi:tRNA A-37 threonylcarbamoyl transferase component Bud32
VPSSDDSQDEEFANSREDQLLRAVAAAPRPDAATMLAARALPELAETLTSHKGSERPPEAGELVDGRYRIEQGLGSGGMGVVFAATHVATGRKVALKWLISRGLYRTQSERDAAVQRFLREAQAAGRIKHPNVVDVYDAGTDPGAPYLVMEKLEGETLRARIERGTIGWDEALEVLVPAMHGVMAAHAQGVVHRDLKPDNIFLAQSAGGAIVPKVLDFGVSRLHVPDSAEPSLTRTGTLIGTPAYMPLEQLRGEGNVDARTDVYALGVMLYEMLAGRRPYVARNAADFAALIASEPPSALGAHRPELRGAREAAVMKALARAPADRQASVQELIDQLGRAAVSRPRSRWPAIVALSLALAGAGMGVWLWNSASEERAAEPIVHEPAPAPELHDRAPELAPAMIEAPAREPPLLAPAPADAPAARAPAARPRGPATRAGAVEPVSPAQPDQLRHEDFTKTSDERVRPAAEQRPRAPEPKLDLGRDQF